MYIHLFCNSLVHVILLCQVNVLMLYFYIYMYMYYYLKCFELSDVKIDTTNQQTKHSLGDNTVYFSYI